MKSFRTELENPLVERDILELEKKIRLFREGKVDEEKFRSLRLARGVYGQRQTGVQMIRIKIPFGKISTQQLLRIADICDEYSNGNLHLTTRQDIQIHYVSLDDAPALWAKLEQDDITLREACGNTVRNVTAAPIAGIDPLEPFDVSPYAQAVFEYFLRKPFCQEMGRKVKIAFSSNDTDNAYTFMHDIGLIPKLQEENGHMIRGFKVMIGGGLGAQPILAKVAHEFLPTEQLIPFIEGVLRVFDRHGERNKRHKARLKYLVEKLGLATFLTLVEEEQKAVLHDTYPIVTQEATLAPLSPAIQVTDETTTSAATPAYLRWKATNTFAQKQAGYCGVFIKIQLGNFSTDTARALVEVIRQYAADDFRITINQGLLLRFVQPQHLPALYEALKTLGLAAAGFDSVADITACPGTDTCNLAISNSTKVSQALEQVIYEEYSDFLANKDIKIKISGCMNACGQHSLAPIGFHGSSFKVAGVVVPALQVLLGGSTLGNGEGRMAERVIKIASKRAPDALRTLLDDYKKNAENEQFHQYYVRQGKKYFYQLLKPQADQSSLTAQEYLDWGQDEKFETAIGVGECAGVVIDLVATLLLEAREKLDWAIETYANHAYGDSLYHAYAAFISGAKALLIDEGIHCNTHHGILKDLDEHFVSTGKFSFENSFREAVLRLKKQAPSAQFAETYLGEAKQFLDRIQVYYQKTPSA
ncbi:MAG: HEPN domain-containing protein [Thermonemataceae bacterium]